MSEKAPSYQQIVDQNESQLHLGNPSVLIERSSKEISVGRYNGQTSGGLEVAVPDINGSYETSYRIVTPEQLSDTYQQRLAAELAGAALQNVVTAPAEKVEPMSELEQLQDAYDTMTSNLSDKDKVALFQYSVALYPYEMDAAEAKMSHGLRTNHELLRTASNAKKRILAIRDAAYFRAAS